MNQVFQTKPHFYAIILKQAQALMKMNKDKTTRTPVEMAAIERHLQPVPLADVDLPKLPLVRLKGYGFQHMDEKKWVVLGEIAQVGKLVLLNLSDYSLDTSLTADKLELVPPTVLTNL